MARKRGYVARRPRHLAAAAASVQVTVERVAASLPEAIEVELVDLSRQGVRVRAAVPLTVGETITVRLRHPTSGFGLERQAKVRWREPHQQGAWSIGCQFFERVEWEALGELFLNDVLSTDPPSPGPDGPPCLPDDAAVPEACDDARSTAPDA